MLPIIDYGSIAIVVSKVVAVGEVVEENEKYGFEVFLAGMKEPLIIGFYSIEEARDSRNELVAIIAQYYYAKEFGPDFELGELFNGSEDEEDEEDESDENDFDKHEH